MRQKGRDSCGGIDEAPGGRRSPSRAVQWYEMIVRWYLEAFFMPRPLSKRRKERCPTCSWLILLGSSGGDGLAYLLLMDSRAQFVGHDLVPIYFRARHGEGSPQALEGRLVEVRVAFVQCRLVLLLNLADLRDKGRGDVCRIEPLQGLFELPRRVQLHVALLVVMYAGVDAAGELPRRGVVGPAGFQAAVPEVLLVELGPNNDQGKPSFRSEHCAHALGVVFGRVRVKSRLDLEPVWVRRSEVVSPEGLLLFLGSEWLQIFDFLFRMGLAGDMRGTWEMQLYLNLFLDRGSKKTSVSSWLKLVIRTCAGVHQRR